MNRKVIAIGIDAPNSQQFDDWIDQGLLPNLGAYVSQGLTGTYTHLKKFRNERCWDTFLSGSEQDRPGAVFRPDSYEFFNQSLQRDVDYTLFYSCGTENQVCAFDLPAPIDPGLQGIQVSGWGSELNASVPVSHPPGVMEELVQRFGKDPKLEKPIHVVDFRTKEAEQSLPLPSIYDVEALNDLKDKLIRAIEKRADICEDLLARNSWDLFLTLFSESHTANHLLWHLGEDFPVASGESQGHAVLEIFQAIDKAIARIVKHLTDNDHVVVYTLDDTAQNTMDVPSMALLPELIYRWDNSGKALLAKGDPEQPPPPMRSDYHLHWKHEIWQLTTDAGKALLESPSQLEARGDPMSWNPANWYKPLWPKMRAFALPSVSDGYIRINVQGREAAGLVSPDEYSAILDELCALLENARNPRSGKPLVKKLIRVRKNPFEQESIPPDLIVCWDGTDAADTLDSSAAIGRIGPLPFFRSGGHLAHGETARNRFIAFGPDIVPGSRARDGKLEDLPATLLHLLNKSIPDTFTGTSLLESRHLAR